MAKATKIVVYFDDGTTYEIDPNTSSSIFLKESAAVHCGHNPPYGKPPKKETATLTAMSTTAGGAESGGGNGDATAGQCYLINGVIVCP